MRHSSAVNISWCSRAISNWMYYFDQRSSIRTVHSVKPLRISCKSILYMQSCMTYVSLGIFLQRSSSFVQVCHAYFAFWWTKRLLWRTDRLFLSWKRWRSSVIKYIHLVLSSATSSEESFRSWSQRWEELIMKWDSVCVSSRFFQLPSSKHTGCFFHYCQCLYRQIQKLGLRQDYSSDESVWMLCRKSMALALMATEQVISGFHAIKTVAGQPQHNPMKELLV